MPPGRKCVFCRSTPVTKEHVWPQWMRRLPGPAIRLAQPHDYNRPHLLGRVSMETGQLVAGLEERGRAIRVTDVTVKMVCGRCNGGWMSRMENRVKPVLTALIQGEKSTVTSDEATLLATWAFKTAGMYQFNDEPTRAISVQDLRFMRAELTPPPRTRIYAFPLATEKNRMRLCNVGSTSQLLGQSNIRKRANVSSTFLGADSVGFLVLHAADGPLFQMMKHFNLPQLWPNPKELRWPREGISDDRSDALAHYQPGFE